MRIPFLLFIMLVTSNSLVVAQTLNEDILFVCMAEALKTAGPDKTVAELQQQCAESIKGAVSQRKIFENQASSNPFAILPYRPNYILPVSYSDANYNPYADILQRRELDDVEIKFQISIKFVAVHDLLINDLDLLVAFTSISWWQAYNSDISAPFRETNYEPELILNYKKPWSIMGLNIDNSFVSLNHQSNGQAGNLSRSWNRVIGGVVFSTGDFIWGVKAWWRFPEKEKTADDGPAGDDNPDIEEFLGNGELGVRWPFNNGQKIDMMLRNNLRSDNKGAIMLGWTFPLGKHLNGYVEYFNGYGESLIYYNEDIERIGFGVKITDWL